MTLILLRCRCSHADKWCSRNTFSIVRVLGVHWCFFSLFLLFFLQGEWWSHFPAAVAGDRQCCFVSVVVNVDSGSFPFLRIKIWNRVSLSAQGHHTSLLCRRNKQNFFPQRSRLLFVFVQPSWLFSVCIWVQVKLTPKKVSSPDQTHYSIIGWSSNENRLTPSVGLLGQLTLHNHPTTAQLILHSSTYSKSRIRSVYSSAFKSLAESVVDPSWDAVSSQLRFSKHLVTFYHQTWAVILVRYDDQATVNFLFCGP